MKKPVGTAVILVIVVLALLLVVGAAAAAPPAQMDGPGRPMPGPVPGGMWGPHGGKPGPWMPAPVVEAEPSGTAVRIDFEVSGHRAHQGLYVVRYPDGDEIASWSAYEGAVDSGWIGDLEITRKSVWVEVVYYPGPHAAPVKMKILNPAPGTAYGWISQGMSHALEVAWPDMPIRPADMNMMPMRPDGMPWGPEGHVGRPGPGGMPGGPAGMPMRPGS